MDLAVPCKIFFFSIFFNMKVTIKWLLSTNSSVFFRSKCKIFSFLLENSFSLLFLTHFYWKVFGLESTELDSPGHKSTDKLHHVFTVLLRRTEDETGVVRYHFEHECRQMVNIQALLLSCVLPHTSSSSSSFICQQKHNIVHRVDTNIQLARHTRLTEHLQ